MEETIKATPAEIEQEIAGLAPLQVIRTETVLSKLPIHNLAKKGSISINISSRNKKGETTLHWEVSPHAKYGEPRQLAYKLDTIVINRRIEEAGKPLPKLVKLGSFREIAAALDLEGGGNAIQRIKTALLQNAFTAITAKLSYEGNDGSEKTLEAAFTRYGVIFTGQKFPDGGKADAVYLILNDPYRDVLNNAPFRPLNYEYLRELAPAPQRFYELVSRRIFGALKHHRAEARLSYSDYCTYSAQQRYTDYDHFKKQMYKVHRPHLASGYLKAIRYRETVDGEGNTDWNMYYVPGPKARAEYQAFARNGRIIDLTEPPGDEIEIPSKPVGKPRRPSSQRRLPFGQPKPIKEPQPASPLVAELSKRGIGEGKARELAAHGDPEFIADQIDWVDHLIRADRHGEIRNPPGFYIRLIEQKVPPPPSFETSRRRKQREEETRKRESAWQLKQEREDAYYRYRGDAIERHLEQQVRPEDLAALTAEQKVLTRKRYSQLPPDTITTIADQEVRRIIGERLSLLSFEEFCLRIDRGEAVL